MKVCFETFGCRLNKAEALNMEALFLANGWDKTTGHSDADLIIVRGCSVTGRAQHDTEKYIARLQAKYPAKRIFTVGCIANKTPEALIEKAMRSANPGGPFVDNAIPTSTARAHLKIQDGCNGSCSYCIVPKFRGKSVSEDFNSVISKAKRFIDCGYEEIVLTGCNLSLYLSDGKRLTDVLTALAGLPSRGHRIRLGSLEPGPQAYDIIKAISDHENICDFLHIPIQSASNKILAEMRRPYTIADIDRLINHAVDHIPNLGLGCDVITGFPAESDCEFKATFDFVKRHPFNNIHAFPYSERPGTMAEKISPSIPKTVRSERAKELSSLVKEKRRNFAKAFRRQKVKVVIEDASTVSGWTSQYLWCTARPTGSAAGAALPHNPRQNLARKSIVEMLVNDSQNDTLFAKII